jgi:hypothetical protein
MKKIMLGLCSLGLSFAAIAAVNDTLLMFSTKGPDRYKNGDDVLAGECYALCYVTDPGAFAIRSDGTAAAGGEVLVTAPAATAMADGSGMHCPDLFYTIPAAKAAALEGGTYAVYLLDTRVPDATAPTGYRVAGVVGGKAAVVNGVGAVATGGTIATDSTGVATFNGTVVAGGQVSVESDVDQPTITAINVDSASIVLKVSGLSPAVSYKVLHGAAPSTVLTNVEGATRVGDTFTVSKDDAGQFFKVVGQRTVQQ